MYLCGQYTADDMLTSVLRAVAGMCKYALNHPHQVTPPVANIAVQPPTQPAAVAAQPTSLLDINRMASRLGVTEAIMRQALLWLEARRNLPHRMAGRGYRAHCGRGWPLRRDQLKQIEEEIEELLAEVRAFASSSVHGCLTSTFILPMPANADRRQQTGAPRNC